MTDYDEIADKFAPVADRMPANRYVERPASLALLPPLKGLDVLDAGCGGGFYTEHAHKAGARVVAFDPSEQMVRHAVERLGGACEIHACSSSELSDRVGGRRFDVILSNLVMHYVEDLNTEFPVLAEMLKPDGRMIVSMKHPFLHRQYIQKHGYRNKGPIDLDWPVGKMTHFHHPLGDITAAIDGAGLVIDRLLEPLPVAEMAEHHLKDYRQAVATPYFIIFVLKKR